MSSTREYIMPNFIVNGTTLASYDEDPTLDDEDPTLDDDPVPSAGGTSAETATTNDPAPPTSSPNSPDVISRLTEFRKQMFPSPLSIPNVRKEKDGDGKTRGRRQSRKTKRQEDSASSPAAPETPPLNAVASVAYLSDGTAPAAVAEATESATYSGKAPASGVEESVGTSAGPVEASSLAMLASQMLVGPPVHRLLQSGRYARVRPNQLRCHGRSFMLGRTADEIDISPLISDDIARNGIQRALILTGTNCDSPPWTILAGHLRCAVARNEGFKDVPVYIIDNLDLRTCLRSSGSWLATTCSTSSACRSRSARARGARSTPRPGSSASWPAWIRAPTGSTRCLPLGRVPPTSRPRSSPWTGRPTVSSSWRTRALARRSQRHSPGPQVCRLKSGRARRDQRGACTPNASAAPDTKPSPKAPRISAVFAVASYVARRTSRSPPRTSASQTGRRRRNLLIGRLAE